MQKEQAEHSVAKWLKKKFDVIFKLKGVGNFLGII